MFNSNFLSKMTKSRFSLRSVAKIAVACLAVCMMFASCSKKNDSGGEGATNGWPPASVLSKYGLDGMSAPAGFKSGFYTEGSDYQLLISFEGNTSTAASVKSYFANGGWVNGGVTNSGGYTTTTYAIVATDGTTRYAVNFLERSDNTFQLTAVKGQ